MVDACVTNTYFSGQGAVLVAVVDAAGNPDLAVGGGFLPLGNVNALTFAIEQTVFEHKESCSGARVVDARLVQEIKATVSFTMEHIVKENLELALFGSSSAVTSGSAVDEKHNAHLGKWLRAEDGINISAVVLTDDPMVVTYVLNDNYQEDLPTGSIRIMTNAEQVAASAANLIAEDDPLLLDYSFAAHSKIEGVEFSASPERWLRFQGLNTANADTTFTSGKPVTVDIYKFQFSPLAELALINEEFTQMEIEGTALSDENRAVGSQIVTIKQII